MQIDKQLEGDITTFKVRGSLSGTSNSSIKLFETVTAEFDAAPGPIVLDLSSVAFIDSMSIGLLVGIILKSREKKKKLLVSPVSEPVKGVILATNLHRAFGPELGMQG